MLKYSRGQKIGDNDSVSSAFVGYFHAQSTPRGTGKQIAESDFGMKPDQNHCAVQIPCLGRIVLQFRA
jgi:hypothetical protein